MPETVEKLLAQTQTHAAAGEWQQAAECLTAAIQHRPNDAGLWFSLGELYRAAENNAPARSAYENALRLAPNFAHAHLHLAIVLDLQMEMEAALHHVLKALEIEPRYEAAAITATNMLLKIGNVEGSRQMGQRAVELAPNSSLAWLNLGNALMSRANTVDEAEEAFRKAITLSPQFAPAHNSFATVLKYKEDFDAAIEHFLNATRLDPNFFPSWANLSQAYLSVGLVGDSIDVARKGLAMAPHATQLSKMLLFTLSYADCPEEQILQEHRQFAEKWITPLKPKNDTAISARSHFDKIRIGYISPDFRDHPIASFIEPLLSSHNQSRFEVFCYQTTDNVDAVTMRLQNHPARWRSISNLLDDQATTVIRTDQLDVAIDLAGHTHGGRLELFARRIAPIQVSYLGYPISSGLSEMDYRLTDSIADPPGEDESKYVEQLIRLPNCFCCFSPPRDAPAIGPLPAEQNVFITFGSLHAMPKVNDAVIGLWANVLSSVPQSRLLMVRNTLTSATQERLMNLFSIYGIRPARITFSNKSNPPGGHLTFYNQIDISLDTFPFTGHTTACQSLFMGVPIVTLTGPSHRHRLVATVLAHAGHKEWIAQTPEEYVEIVSHLAGDIAGLAKVREHLRQELIASPLCDAASFTKDFEFTIDRLVREQLENRRVSS